MLAPPNKSTNGSLIPPTSLRSASSRTAALIWARLASLRRAAAASRSALTQMSGMSGSAGCREPQGRKSGSETKTLQKPGALCKNIQKIGSFWMKICLGKMTSTFLAQRKGYVFWKPSPAKMTWLLHSPTKWCFYSSKHHVSSKTFVRLAESHQWSMLHKSPN